MTNGEKFKEVFGFRFNANICAMPENIECPTENCDDCQYDKWLDQEYKEQGAELDLKAIKNRVMGALNAVERDRSYRPYDSNFWEGFYEAEEIVFNCFNYGNEV